MRTHYIVEGTLPNAWTEMGRKSREEGIHVHVWLILRNTVNQLYANTIFFFKVSCLPRDLSL